jgi:hypothetical protein
MLKGAPVGAEVVSVAAAVANSDHDWRARLPRGCLAMPAPYGHPSVGSHAVTFTTQRINRPLQGLFD